MEHYSFPSDVFIRKDRTFFLILRTVYIMPGYNLDIVKASRNILTAQGIANTPKFKSWGPVIMCWLLSI